MLSCISFYYHSYKEERVVVDGNIVTSRGPGTAIEFALQLVKILCGDKERDDVDGPMLNK
eukprot:m.33390 g.33390  ORF g.33390 m.33390 type:complete len:60 (+) comp8528_c0_seq3:452-631(+)